MLVGSGRSSAVSLSCQPSRFRSFTILRVSARLKVVVTGDAEDMGIFSTFVWKREAA